MGGAIAEGNVTPAAEFNIWVDPEAAARVFASGLDVTMVGLDVTHRALLTDAHAQRLRAAGRTGTLVADLHGFYAACTASATAGTARRSTTRWRSPMWSCRASWPRSSATSRSTASRELCRGRTVVDLWRRTGRPANAHVATEVDADAFLDLLIERVRRAGLGGALRSGRGWASAQTSSR